MEALDKEEARLHRKINMIYDDKLCGVIDHDFWAQKHAETKAELSAVERSRAAHKKANIGYLESGVSLLELVKNVHSLYIRQTPYEKRRLLNCVLSNCTLEGENLCYDYKKPFDFFLKKPQNEENRKQLENLRTYLRENQEVIEIQIRESGFFDKRSKVG